MINWTIHFMFEIYAFSILSLQIVEFFNISITRSWFSRRYVQFVEMRFFNKVLSWFNNTFVNVSRIRYFTSIFSSFGSSSNPTSLVITISSFPSSRLFIMKLLLIFEINCEAADDSKKILAWIPVDVDLSTFEEFISKHIWKA